VSAARAFEFASVLGRVTITLVPSETFGLYDDESELRVCRNVSEEGSRTQWFNEPTATVNLTKCQGIPAN
jgi:hypothetical protein